MTLSEELRDVRENIDRVCRVEGALRVANHGSERRELMFYEHERATNELLVLRARERELMAGMTEQVSVEAAADAIEEASAEGIAQGRRELAVKLRGRIEKGEFSVASYLSDACEIFVRAAKDVCRDARAVGRRELAREALARGGGSSTVAHVSIVEFLAAEANK